MRLGPLPSLALALALACGLAACASSRPSTTVAPPLAPPRVIPQISDEAAVARERFWSIPTVADPEGGVALAVFSAPPRAALVEETAASVGLHVLESHALPGEQPVVAVSLQASESAAGAWSFLVALSAEAGVERVYWAYAGDDVEWSEAYWRFERGDVVEAAARPALAVSSTGLWLFGRSFDEGAPALEEPPLSVVARELGLPGRYFLARPQRLALLQAGWPTDAGADLELHAFFLPRSLADALDDEAARQGRSPSGLLADTLRDDDVFTLASKPRVEAAGDVVKRSFFLPAGVLVIVGKAAYSEDKSASHVVAVAARELLARAAKKRAG